MAGASPSLLPRRFTFGRGIIICQQRGGGRAGIIPEKASHIPTRKCQKVPQIRLPLPPCLENLTPQRSHCKASANGEIVQLPCCVYPGGRGCQAVADLCNHNHRLIIAQHFTTLTLLEKKDFEMYFVVAAACMSNRFCFFFTVLFQ